MRPLFIFVLLLAGCGYTTPTPICAPGAYLDPSGDCRAQSAPLHHLPFREGFKTQVTQGFHGVPTHKDELSYAVDLDCKLGDPVVASRSGRVLYVREDSQTGCAAPSCKGDANFVLLDHGDGTFSEYHHLMYKGALVEQGDMVCSGQVVGMCGSTGFSTGPHLHFAVSDLFRRTMPVRFVEAARQTGFAFPSPGTHYTSENKLRTGCRAVEHSMFPEGAFAHQGIMLDQELPVVVQGEGRKQRVSGRYFGDYTHVAISRLRPGDEDWIRECVPVDEDGEFEVIIVWGPERFPPDRYGFMINASSEACDGGGGWSRSFRVVVR